MKRIVVNILAVIILFLLILVIVTLNSANSARERNNSDIAISSFTGPISNPSGIEGPPGPPPSGE